MVMKSSLLESASLNSVQTTALNVNVLRGNLVLQVIASKVYVVPNSVHPLKFVQLLRHYHPAAV
ncbi:hypothetical protein BgiBS90_030138, partial [Biomphalaria glabrata]